MLVYFLLIVGFTYFYVAITFNPVEVADNMKKYGGFIPGIRAGRPTAEYLDYVLTRITLPARCTSASSPCCPSSPSQRSAQTRTSRSAAHRS
jgi:preprotein translocase subunit SecY